MPRQTGKGRGRRQAAFEHRATKHREFVGDADAERAEAEFRKQERIEATQNEDVVREMARELEQAAGIKGDGAAGPEFPVRLPRSIEDGKRMIREAPDALREKARERLEKLPEPAQKAIGLFQEAAGLLFAPVRIGFALAREVLQVPGAMIRVLRHKEA